MDQFEQTVEGRIDEKIIEKMEETTNALAGSSSLDQQSSNLAEAEKLKEELAESKRQYQILEASHNVLRKEFSGLRASLSSKIRENEILKKQVIEKDLIIKDLQEAAEAPAVQLETTIFYPIADGSSLNPPPTPIADSPSAVQSMSPISIEDSMIPGAMSGSLTLEADSCAGVGGIEMVSEPDTSEPVPSVGVEEQEASVSESASISADESSGSTRTPGSKSRYYAMYIDNSKHVRL